MKIYAVAITAQKCDSGSVAISSLSMCIRGKSFETVYETAHKSARENFPEETYSNHWVGFAEVPTNWITEAAEIIKQQQEN